MCFLSWVVDILSGLLWRVKLISKLGATHLGNYFVFCKDEMQRRKSSFSSALLLSVLLLTGIFLGMFLWHRGFCHALKGRSCAALSEEPSLFSWGWEALQGQLCAWLWNLLYSDNHNRTFPFSSLLNKKVQPPPGFRQPLAKDCFLFVVLCWFWLGLSLLLCVSSNQISICSVGKCVRHKRDPLCMWTEICCFPLFLKPLAWFFSKLVSHIPSVCLCWLSS